MKVLVVYCHPNPESFTAAVRDTVLAEARKSTGEIRVLDLYASGFDPVLCGAELAGYVAAPANRTPVSSDVDDLLWCDTLVFVYPTWWYGLPAMLKGWLDRVMLPEVAFLMPDETNRTIRPGLGHIRRLGVFTTCGASWWLTQIVGAPGKRTLMRGVGFLCAKPLRTAFAAHYLMDTSTPESRRKHLDRVRRKAARLFAGG